MLLFPKKHQSMENLGEMYSFCIQWFEMRQ